MATTFKFAHPLILALAAGLSACTCTPDGFVEVPKVAEYFKSLAPTAGKSAVEMVSICPMGMNGRWSTSILFEDGNLYHYEYSFERDAVELHHHTTLSQRLDNRAYYNDEPDDCLAHQDTIFAHIEKFSMGSVRHPSGSYRIHIDNGTLHGYVYERIVVNKPFDAVVEKHFKEAAFAVQAAIKAHAKFTPVEASWGIKP